MRFLMRSLFWLLILFSFIVNSSLANASTDYYVSASMGHDDNDGLSMSTPWASLARVTNEKLIAGDTVKFKAGDSFAGQLIIDESGELNAPIRYTAYGQGNAPIIDGSAGSNGSELAAILVIDQDHIEISHLTVRNFRKQSKANVADVNAYGIFVKNTGKRVLSGFNLHHLTVEAIYPIKAKNRLTIHL